MVSEMNLDNPPKAHDHEIITIEGKQSALVKSSLLPPTETNDRANAIDLVLSKLFKGPVSFTCSRLIEYRAPDKWLYTFDHSAAPYSITDIYNHIHSAVLNRCDPCIAPLIEICRLSKQVGPISEFPSTTPERIAQLTCLTLSDIVHLTRKQREHVAQIHQNPIIREKISDLLQREVNPVFVHGDFRFVNILFRPPSQIHPLHIIDWAEAGIGPRVYDWATLMVDYILVYLSHFTESGQNPTQIHWDMIEELMGIHLNELHPLYENSNTTLAQEYYQWLGAILILISIRLIHHHALGDALTELAMKIGCRFLVEFDDLHKKYGHYYAK